MTLGPAGHWAINHSIMCGNFRTTNCEHALSDRGVFRAQANFPGFGDSSLNTRNAMPFKAQVRRSGRPR
jgi:hypothetical protein